MKKNPYLRKSFNKVSVSGQTLQSPPHHGGASAQRHMAASWTGSLHFPLRPQDADGLQSRFCDFS